ncbi:MAG: hypothetical protein BYD32DRAFT_427112 [Podila humilis]|nr:MAG: hypothetical protein BYD32DRAFT_427112 [Podila humilis]
MKQQSAILILPSLLFAASMVHAQNCFAPGVTPTTCLPVLGQCRTDYVNSMTALSTCQAALTTSQQALSTCQSQSTSTAHENYCRCCMIVELHNCCNHGTAPGMGGCKGGQFQSCYDHVWNNIFTRCLNDPNERCPSRDAEGRCSGKEAFTAKRNQGLFSQY